MSFFEKAIQKVQEASRVPPAVGETNTRVPPLSRDSEAVVVTTAPIRQSAAAMRKVLPGQKQIAINRTALRMAGLLPPEHQERLIADQYRQIKRPLIANAVGRGVPKLPRGFLVMMASAVPGEGKTFTSINLALSLAQERDINVLLVDADVAKPHISQIFGVDKELGLLDALIDDSLDLEMLTIATDIPGLSVLPAGRHSDTATELLTSSHMTSTLARLGAHDPNRIILLDSPPLLLTSESRALASVVGQVVIVVRAGVTSQHAVLDAISHIGEDKAVGLILNQSETAASEGYYYGHAEYGDSVTVQPRIVK